MFENYEDVKMKILENQEYYIISANWLRNWKLFVGYDGMEGGEFPGSINNEDIIEVESHKIICDEKR